MNDESSRSSISISICICVCACVRTSDVVAVIETSEHEIKLTILSIILEATLLLHHTCASDIRGLQHLSNDVDIVREIEMIVLRNYNGGGIVIDTVVDVLLLVFAEMVTVIVVDGISVFFIMLAFTFMIFSLFLSTALHTVIVVVPLVILFMLVLVIASVVMIMIMMEGGIAHVLVALRIQTNLLVSTHNIIILLLFNSFLLREQI